MEQKIKINVTVSRYVYGKGIQYTSNVEPLYIDEKLLNGQILSLSAINDYCSAIYNYCKEFAKNTIPYNANYENYLLQFWHNDEMISSALLSDYADYFGRNL